MPSLPKSIAMPNHAARLSRFSYPFARRWLPHFYFSFPCIPLSLFLCIFFCYKASFYLFHHLVFSNASSTIPPQCVSDRRTQPQSLLKLPAEEKFMFYAPHSGFSNQVGELKNALLIAALLNRTLILPPVFDHHAVALGSCPKSRVSEPDKMRSLAWLHISELIRSGRYVAIADIIDISSIVSSSLVKTIDLRIFALLWCGVDVVSACSGSLCSNLVTLISTWGTLESCGTLLSSPELVPESCVFGVNEDCRTTIWVHGLEGLNMSYLQGTVNESQLTSRTLNREIGHRKMKKVYRKIYKDIVGTLGLNSNAARYKILSFGSLFSSEYKGAQLHVDIHPGMDRRSRTLFEAIQVFPFTPPIVNAGKMYLKEKIKHPFFCAQLRLLDGQFKKHWGKTFSSLKSQLQFVRKHRGASEVLHLFLMTDLPLSNWNGTYLGELVANPSSYKVYFIEDSKDFILDAAEEVSKKDYGLRSGFLPDRSSQRSLTARQGTRFVPDILLYVQEIICSCATLGFVGTSGSTIAGNILQLRNANACTSTSVNN